MENNRAEIDCWRAINAPDIVGQHPSLLAALSVAERVSPLPCPVIITGESGTGKELFARAIHDGSGRKEFVAINCAAIPNELIESELFGHRRGSFSGSTSDHPGAFVEADGGTLFLDEIGELPLAAQSKLLRVLQDGTIRVIGGGPRRVNVRVLCATNRDVRDPLVMREDLYHRLACILIPLPALRCRPSDIPCLVQHFAAVIAAEMGAAPIAIEPGLMMKFTDFCWPGNIRELYHFIYSLIAVGPESILDRLANSVPIPPTPRTAPAPGEHRPISFAQTKSRPVDLGSMPSLAKLLLQEGFNLADHIEHVRETLVHGALAISGDNKAEAARLLGMNRTTLVEFLRAHQRKSMKSALAAA